MVNIVPHLFAEFAMRRHFPARVLNAIQRAVVAGETLHDGQVRFAIEGGQRVGDVWRNVTPRQSAENAFARLRVWDTRDNSGVLIYVLPAEHAIEIVADRGIAAKVGPAEWDSICIQMQNHFATGDFERGAVEGVGAVSALLAKHFPATVGKKNELPDRPILI